MPKIAYAQNFAQTKIRSAYEIFYAMCKQGFTCRVKIYVRQAIFVSLMYAGNFKSLLREENSLGARNFLRYV